jgi:hypothetical protein
MAMFDHILQGFIGGMPRDSKNQSNHPLDRSFISNQQNKASQEYPKRYTVLSKILISGCLAGNVLWRSNKQRSDPPYRKYSFIFKFGSILSSSMCAFGRGLAILCIQSFPTVLRAKNKHLIVVFKSFGHKAMQPIYNTSMLL